MHNGILGSFCFNANGDPTTTPVTILQAKRPGSDQELDASGTQVIETINTAQSSIP